LSLTDASLSTLTLFVVSLVTFISHFMRQGHQTRAAMTSVSSIIFFLPTDIISAIPWMKHIFKKMDRNQSAIIILTITPGTCIPYGILL
jgi:hypothetical protein